MAYSASVGVTTNVDMGAFAIPGTPELQDATDKLRAAAKRNNVILGLFLFGTARVAEFLAKDFTFISIGNDLHHILTQATAYVKDMETIAAGSGKTWTRRPTALM